MNRIRFWSCYLRPRTRKDKFLPSRLNSSEGVATFPGSKSSAETACFAFSSEKSLSVGVLGEGAGEGTLNSSLDFRSFTEEEDLNKLIKLLLLLLFDFFCESCGLLEGSWVVGRTI